jgi:hypothetical protein
MSLIGHRDGYYDKDGQWQRTKFCFVYCGERCTCSPPNGIYNIKMKDEIEKRRDKERKDPVYNK